ncbi:MAG: hypothetical protein AAGM46_26265 [Cyanobacteria bacterium J06582_2]
MADFDDTVIEAATKLEEVMTNSQSTQAKLTEFEAQLTEISQNINLEWSELEGKSRSLLAQINSARQELGSNAQNVVQTLVQWRTSVESLETQFTESKENIQTEIGSFGEDLENQQTALGEGVEAVEGTVKSLTENMSGLEEALDNTATEMQELFQADFTEIIQAQAKDIEAGGENLSNSIAEDAIPALDELGTEFTEGLAATTDSVETALKELTAKSKESSQELMGEVKGICDEYQRELKEEAQLFDQFMNKRAEIIQDGAVKIGEALESGLTAAMKDNHEQAEKTVELFDKVKGELENFV